MDVKCPEDVNTQRKKINVCLELGTGLGLGRKEDGE